MKEAVFRNRKHILKYLVLNYLRDEGYEETANTFIEEAAITDEYTVCDNVALDMILQEYTVYYMMKFDKQPLFCKKVEEKPSDDKIKRKATAKKRATRAEDGAVKLSEPAPAMLVTQLFKELEHNYGNPIDQKSISVFLSNVSPEKREIAQSLYRDMVRDSSTKWEDVKGLESAKSLLLECVVYPARYPGVFTGVLSPWRGLLLHGPPGAGKTLLARATAGETRAAFFNVTASSLVNKWRGESEKIVKTLFEMAAYYSPSIIFMDEVESLVSERDSSSEHEASRRLKSQLLTELDGVDPAQGNIFLLACSNIPWDIDSAMLRRLEKRIFIPLPDLEARAALFGELLSSAHVALEPAAPLRRLAELTDGYSGADIKVVCKEAVMSGLRKRLPDLCQRGDATLKHRVSLQDVEIAINKTKPISKKLAEKHRQWQNCKGSS